MLKKEALEYLPANHREEDNNLVEISAIYEVAKSVLEHKKELSFSDLDKEPY